MFDSQFCSLVTITCLVQFFGLAMVICYRLRGAGKSNQLGLMFGILVMAATTMVCLGVNLSAGIGQGVGLVLVAVCSTLHVGTGEASPI